MIQKTGKSALPEKRQGTPQKRTESKSKVVTDKSKRQKGKIIQIQFWEPFRICKNFPQDVAWVD